MKGGEKVSFYGLKHTEKQFFFVKSIKFIRYFNENCYLCLWKPYW